MVDPGFHSITEVPRKDVDISHEHEAAAGQVGLFSCCTTMLVELLCLCVYVLSGGGLLACACGCACNCGFRWLGWVGGYVCELPCEGEGESILRVFVWLWPKHITFQLRTVGAVYDTWALTATHAITRSYTMYVCKDGLCMHNSGQSYCTGNQIVFMYTLSTGRIVDLQNITSMQTKCKSIKPFPGSKGSLKLVKVQTLSNCLNKHLCSIKNGDVYWFHSTRIVLNIIW